MMAALRILPLILELVATQSGESTSPTTTGSRAATLEPTPALVNTWIITSNVKRLVAFYESALGMKA
jgi:hypothetical protein